MRSPYAQVAAIVVIGLCVSPARSQLLPSQARGAARAQVVMLSVKGGCAAGIIVGYDEKVVYIATAAHIADLSTRPFPPVSVKFEGLSKPPGAGTFWPQFEPKGKGDLAVVTVGRDPSLNKFLDELDFALLSPVPLGPKDTPVTSIGCFGGAEWSSGNNETLLTPAQGYLRFQSEVGEGQSGGGLYNEAWELIGMPLEVGDNGVYVRPIDEILEHLRKWGVPTRLAARPLKNRVRGADEIARENAAEALSRYLLDKADSLKDGDYNQVQASALLRIEAGRRSSLLETSTALRESSTVLPVLQVLQDETTAMGFSADGELFLSAGGKSLQISSMETLTALWRKDLDDTIIAAALSPDGRLAAAGDNTGTLSAFDARSGRQLWTLRNFGRVTALSISPDGRYVIGTAQGGGAVLLEGASGRVVQAFQSTYTFDKVAFSPDAKRFTAFGGSRACEADRTCGGKVLLFNLEDRSQRLLEQPRPVLDLRFMPRGDKLITTSAEGMHFYTLDGEPLADDKNIKTWDDYFLREAHIDPRGFYVATTGGTGTMTLWFVPGPDSFVPSQVQYHTGMILVNTFAFSGPAHYLAAGGFGLTAVYETGLETGRNKQVFRFRSPGNSLSLLFSQDDSFLATGGETGVQVFALKPGRVRSMTLHAPNASVSFVCGGRYLAYEFREDEEFRLLDPGTGVQKAAFHPGKFELAEASCDGNYIAVRTKDDYHKGRVLNRDGRGVLSLELPSINGISCLGITRDSRTLTIAGSSRGVQYDLATGQLLGSFELKESVNFSYVSPSGHFLVGGGYVGSNGTYFLYRFADKTLRDLGMSANRIAFTPDDRLYAITEGKGPIRVYEAASGRLLFEFPYEEESTSLTFSADGRLLASSGGKHIRVFDVSNGQPVARIEAGAGVFSISFSEDLTRLYTVELRELPETDAMPGVVSPFKWEVVEYLLSTSLLIDDNCRRLTRNLTREEWNLYLTDAAYRETCPLSGQ